MENEIKLPKGFIDRYLPKGKETHMFGQPVKDFNTEQLLAAIGCTMSEIESNAERAKHTRDFLIDLTRRTH